MELRKFRQNLGQQGLPLASLMQMGTQRNGSLVVVPGRLVGFRKWGLGKSKN